MLRDQVPLLVHLPKRRRANPCHQIATGARAHKGQGRSVVAGVKQADGFMQFGELAHHQRRDFGNRALLHRVAGDRLFHVGDRARARVNGGPVNTKIVRIAGEEIAALLALRNANGGHNSP